MSITMEVGDIWRKDTRALHPDNPIVHWLITKIDSYEDTSGAIVHFLILEAGRSDYKSLATIDMTGNPYWKKVA